MEILKLVEKELDYAWAGGIMDGEACFTLSKTHQLILRIEMVHKPTLERIQQIFDTGKVLACTKRSDRQAWCWYVTGKEVASVIDKILPFLTTKYQEALLSYEYAMNLRDLPHPGRAGHSKREREYREETYKRLKELKMYEWEREV